MISAGLEAKLARADRGRLRSMVRIAADLGRHAASAAGVPPPFNRSREHARRLRNLARGLVSPGMGQRGRPGA